MESMIAAIRLVHVAAGTLALVVARIPMLTAQGGRTHRRWGQVYFSAMADAAVTRVIRAAWRPVDSLALLAVFSFSLAFYGYRARFRRAARRSQRVVVRSHARYARLLHRYRHGLLRGELHVPADHGPLALADRRRHAVDHRLDHLLQVRLPPRTRTQLRPNSLTHFSPHFRIAARNRSRSLSFL